MTGSRAWAPTTGCGPPCPRCSLASGAGPPGHPLLLRTPSPSRKRSRLDCAPAGEPIRIAALGGSITTGAHQRDGLPWPQYVYNYLEDEYGGNNGTIRGSNGALGGTRSSYMSVW